MSEVYSVYTRVGKSEPPLLLELGKTYHSSTGGSSVAKKAIRQLKKSDPCLRKKQVYIRKHSSNVMKVYKASTKKITPKTVQLGNTLVTYKMKPSAKYSHILEKYRIVNIK